MTSRITGAILRAMLVVVMITLPAALLVDVSADTQQMVTFAALLLGLITFVEYNAAYPSMIEFRDAAPVNRLRFVMLLSALGAITLAQPATLVPIGLRDTALSLAGHVGAAMDFPYSPAWLVSQLASGSADAARLEFITNAAGLAYLISLSWLGLFAVIVRVGGWPASKKPLNVWVNLPMFDPTAGGDVVARLSRDGRVNILLGFVLPFILPVAAKLVFGQTDMLETAPLHSLIWIIALWAFLPASLILRGLALLRIAELIIQSRAARGAELAKSFAPA